MASEVVTVLIDVYCKLREGNREGLGRRRTAVDGSLKMIEDQLGEHGWDFDAVFENYQVDQKESRRRSG